MLTFSKAVFEGVPSFFRACCFEAARRAPGVESYAHPGRELTRHLGDLIPYDVELDDWIEILDELAELIEQDDDDSDSAILQWFVEHYPKCMALVPRRRRAAFLQGVREMAVAIGSLY